MAIKKVNKLVFENGTSSFNVLGLTTGGEEVFATVPMTKMVEWNGLVGYKPWDIPGMMLALISKIEKQGYQLAKKGKISIITRQHDILPVDERLNPLTPITSWQNNNTNDQSQALDIPDITSVVGPIAPRLGLAKIERMRALDPTLAEKVSWWTVSGDWIAMQLTGERFTSISDALGNLFVNQDSRELAVDIFEKVGLNPDCFAPLLENGEIFGTVKQSGSEIWPFYDLARKLLSWEILATKGDNPAAALIIADTETMVLSGGSSGPASRLINWPAKLAGKAACFDGHSGMRMPLTMLDWCALRYNAFIARTYRTNKPDLSAIDVAAFDVLQNHPEQILFVKQFVSSNSQWRN